MVDIISDHQRDYKLSPCHRVSITIWSIDWLSFSSEFDSLFHQSHDSFLWIFLISFIGLFSGLTVIQ